MATKVQIKAPLIQKNIMSIPIQVNYDTASGDQHGTIEVDITTIRQWIPIVSNEAFDFMFFSFCVYGIDRFIPRKSHSVDGWSREIEISLPVQQTNKWNRINKNIANAISFLTGDYWTVSFYKMAKPVIPALALDEVYNQKFSQVNLFSGGLDSLIGAIDKLETGSGPILFVSHYDSNMRGPKKDQSKLVPELSREYGDRFVHIPSIKAILKKHGKGETTSRSRSIVFIGIANFFASAINRPICVPENGTVSVNYPLSPSRRGSCSTRTTHPTFLDHLRTIFEELKFNSTIFNPYRFMTKGEMVKHCKNQKLLAKILELSNSCGKRGHRAHWDYMSASHCGICMPCVYRRSALFPLKDRTTYGNEIKKLNLKSKKGQDISILNEFLKEKVTLKEIRYELLANGLKDLSHLDDFVDLVDRSRKELKKWFGK